MRINNLPIKGYSEDEVWKNLYLQTLHLSKLERIKIAQSFALQNDLSLQQDLFSSTKPFILFTSEGKTIKHNNFWVRGYSENEAWECLYYVITNL